MAGAVIGDEPSESATNSRALPDLETQKKEIGLLLKAPLISGEIWYLVDSRWLKCWKKYVGFDSWDIYGVGEDVNHPGPIDNSILFKDVEENILKQHLIDELDYNLMPMEAWKKLVSWYGIAEGQQPIQRKVVEHGMYLKQCKVEVYLIELKLCQNSDLETVISKSFSKGDTIENIMTTMKEIFQIPENVETRLWNKYMGNTYELLSNMEQTVQDVGLYSGQLVIIEMKNEDGTWQRQGAATSKSNFSSSSLSSSSSGYGSTSNYGYGSSYNSWDYSSGGRKTAPQPGLSGLSNLGNTCFMNSALQCLSNTPHLTKYFVREEYKDELNYDNPLGMRGEIAKAYAGLLLQIWTGEYSAVAPRQFKTQVGRFAPQFSGYQQQDSQELLAFLLDGLHEDLNRIQKKPYIELKDADNRPDKVVAQEAWQNHRKRNDSIIVDIFHGQFKSTLVCPDCDKVSVTFDPFCYLSLPLPVKKERSLEVFLVRNDAMKKPILFKLTVPKLGTVGDLLQVLSKEANVPKEKMIVTDVYNHRLHKIFSTSDSLSSILDRDDIFIYEVVDASDTTIIPVYMREKRLRLTTYSTGGKTLFGLPLLVSIPSKGLPYNGLYNLLLNRMRRYVTPPKNEVGADCEKNRDTKTNGPVGTDVEMSEVRSEEQDPETEEDQLEKATQNVHVNGDDDDADDEVDADADTSQQKDNKTKTKKKNRLFTMTLVNAYGSSDFQSLIDDGDKPLTFSSRSYLALDWSSKTKEKYYNSEAAEESDQHESVTRKPAQKKNCVQLSDCIEMFISKERLGANDPWYCPTCKKHQQATKKFDLWTLPEVLVVHLKRFSYNSFWRDKLDTLVDFPIRGLDMTKYVINHEQPRPVYDLIAVSNHYGGMGGGHYTAYARNCHDSSWYSFDDSSVTPCDENQIVSKAAYVLFYQRRRSHRVSVLSDKAEAAASNEAMGAEDDDWIDEGKDPDDDEDMDTK